MGVRYSNYTSDRKQPPKSGYGFLKAVVQGVISRAGPLIEKLDAPHRTGGNPGYSGQAMLSAYVMRYALGQRYANVFLNQLGSHARLLEICGLPWAPGERAFSDFKNHKLVKRRRMLQAIIVEVFLECGVEIERLRALGLVPADKPPLGAALVMDSTDVLAWARPSRKSRKTGEEIPSKDSDARWGYRTAKNKRSRKVGSGKRRRSRKVVEPQGDADEQEDKGETYFGYSVNIAADPNYGLPMFAETRPANANDSVVMIPDLDACLALYWTLSPRYFLGDKGYDSLKNILYVIRLGMIPIIAVRQPPKNEEGQRLYDGIYTGDGRPTCVGGKPMEYAGTDRNRVHLFECPAEGCHLKDKVLATGFCKDRHYEKPEGRLLRIVGLLPRCSEEWKTEYKKRPTIERFNGSAKHSRLLDQHRNFNIIQMSLHVLMSLLTYLATALAHLQADDYAHMRHMRIKLPAAKGIRRNRRQSPTPACRDPGCGCCARWREAA